MFKLKNKEEIERQRAACIVVKEVLELVEKNVDVGVSTLELDTIAEDFIIKSGGKPAFKGYGGFPNTACISVNDVVIHGIPSEYKLKDGDIVSFDVGVLKDGMYGDAARSFCVGSVDEDSRQLVEVTKNSFFEGIKNFKVGGRLSDISFLIEEYVDGFNYGIVRSFTGHGIGYKLHEEPAVPNYGKPGRGMLLRAGTVLAIEPMITMGSHEVYIDKEDKWTVRTVDGSLSAHYENTVALTNDGLEILTL